MCSCRFAWQAWHFVTFDAFQPDCRCATVVAEKLPCLWGRYGKVTRTCPSRRVLQEECVCATVVAEKLLCLWGKPQKRIFLDVSEDVLMSFCLAGVALCDSRCVSARMCVRDGRGRKAAVSTGKATKTCLSRRVRRCAHVVLRGRRDTLRQSTRFSPNVCAPPSWQKSCRVHGESHKNVSFSTCQKMCSCRFAWQAWHFVTVDVFQEECVCATVVGEKLPCPPGKPQKRVFLKVSEDVLMSFCMAGVTLCDSRCVSAGMCVRDRGSRKVAVSMEKATKGTKTIKNVSFSTCQKMCSCRFAWHAWHAWHFVTFDVFQEECVCATVVAEKLPCPWGKPQTRVFLDVSEDVLMPFCVAGVALCDIRCVSAGMCARPPSWQKSCRVHRESHKQP